MELYLHRGKEVVYFEQSDGFKALAQNWCDQVTVKESGVSLSAKQRTKVDHHTIQYDWPTKWMKFFQDVNMFNSLSLQVNINMFK